MNDLLDRLRARRWRLTAQRRVVAQALEGDNVHLTADEVLVRARELLPEISRATVYNTLNDLVLLGEVAEVADEGRSKRYDPNGAHPHQHLLCTVCGRLDDVVVDLDACVPHPGDLGEFLIDEVDVVFRGRCLACR